GGTACGRAGAPSVGSWFEEQRRSPQAAPFSCPWTSLSTTRVMASAPSSAIGGEMTHHLSQGTSHSGRALYDRHRHARGAAGIGFIAGVHGRTSRAILDAALCGLERLRHRGAVAADAKTGDGAGVLVPLPEGFFAGPEAGRPGVAMAFLPSDLEVAKEARRLVEQALVAEGLELLRWRPVPVEHAALGELARATAPLIEQAVFRVTTGDPEPGDDAEAERRCFRAGRRAVQAARTAEVPLYLASCSTRTVTYKALCAGDQLRALFPDLASEALEVAFAVFHQRFSTNTAPSWERAQPFRFLCHNGEINTLDGNVAWMRAREGHLGAGELDEDLLR